MNNQLRSTHINAEVRPGTKEDALWFALGANRKNGRRLTESDKRHAIVLALQAFHFGREQGMSERQIAEQVGCAYSFVTKVKNEVHTECAPAPSRTVGKDGKTYPATRKKAAPTADVPAAPRHAQHDEIAARLKAGETVSDHE